LEKGPKERLSERLFRRERKNTPPENTGRLGSKDGRREETREEKEKASWTRERKGGRLLLLQRAKVGLWPANVEKEGRARHVCK